MRKFSRRPTLPVPSGAVLQLSCGQDFFRNGFGNRHTQVTITAMRRAWQDSAVRHAVFERTLAAHGPGVRPFAFHLFGDDGRDRRLVTVSDVTAARDAYRAEWERPK